MTAASNSSRSFHVALLYPPPPASPARPLLGETCSLGLATPCVSGSVGTGAGPCAAPGLDARPGLRGRGLGSTWLSLEGPLEVPAASPC